MSNSIHGFPDMSHVFSTEIDGRVILLDGRSWQFFALDDGGQHTAATSSMRAGMSPVGTLEPSGKTGLRVSPFSGTTKPGRSWLTAGESRVQRPILREAAGGARARTPEDASQAEPPEIEALLADRALAFCSLLVARWLVRCLSLDRLVQLLVKVKRLRNRDVQRTRVLAIRAAVSASSAHSVIRAACLEESLATFLALLVRGQRATWCIGVRTPPFQAHAWTECDGEPLGEYPVVVSTMAKIVAA